MVNNTQLQLGISKTSNKGHEDDDKEYEDLTRDQQLNVLADQKAKKPARYQIDNNIMGQTRVLALPFTKCSIFAKGHGNTIHIVHSK